MKVTSLTILLACSCLAGRPAQGAVPSWPQFRGPNGQGVAEQDHPPTEFGPGTNLVWKTEVPGGVSSPCVWGDRIFLTAFSSGKLETLGIDRYDGHVRWRQVAPAEQIQRAHEMGSPASATPATDGRRVYVYFGSFGLLAYDFEGREQWRKPLPPPDSGAGTGTSPVLAGRGLVLNCDQEEGQSYLLAVDRRDGRTLWRTPRPGFTASYSTPVVRKNKRGVSAVASPLFYRGRVYVVQDGGRVTCYDAETGVPHYQQERLGVEGSYHASPVAAGGRIFFCAKPGTVTAVAAGDSLQILARNVLGETIIATPAIADDTIYVRTAEHLWAFGEAKRP